MGRQKTPNRQNNTKENVGTTTQCQRYSHKDSLYWQKKTHLDQWTKVEIPHKYSQ